MEEEDVEALPRELAVDELERLRERVGNCRKDVEKRKRLMAEAFRRLRDSIETGDIQDVREEFEEDFSKDMGELLESFDECMQCFGVCLHASDVLIRTLKSELSRSE